MVAHRQVGTRDCWCFPSLLGGCVNGGHAGAVLVSGCCCSASSAPLFRQAAGLRPMLDGRSEAVHLEPLTA